MLYSSFLLCIGMVVKFVAWLFCDLVGAVTVCFFCLGAGVGLIGEVVRRISAVTVIVN